jgi:hypothetical protein
MSGNGMVRGVAMSEKRSGNGRVIGIAMVEVATTR